MMNFWMKKVLFYTFHKLYWGFWRCSLYKSLNLKQKKATNWLLFLL
ncbi:hypothetical protein THERMOT_594 [Bathymodiolus thermophilus thioautotrophic gill symbiont]|nr:hypothetical protein THERMOT_594 [Bathymodiolus thermophilus thioautotrophic gill symbiont]